MPHVHEPAEKFGWPSNGNGWAVCTCGATRRMEGGKLVGEWHACMLCVADPEAREAART